LACEVVAPQPAVATVTTATATKRATTACGRTLKVGSLSVIII